MPVWEGRIEVRTPDLCTPGSADRITFDGRRSGDSPSQAVLAADVAAGGWLMWPIPRGIGETT